MNETFALKPIKRVATINDEALGETTDPDFELQYIDIGNVDSNGNVHEIAVYRFEAAPSRARRIVRDGDVIISTVRTYLQAIASIKNPPSNLIVSTGFAVVRPSSDKLDVGFCKYALRESRFIQEVVNRSVGVSYPAITAMDLANIPIFVPPLSEQRAIADYLDRETARLDSLIAAKERLLELLAEKRRAVITHAVTRGLNGNVSLRDSGMEWLGEIPSHWKKVKIKHIAQVGNGSTPFREKLEYWLNGSYPWLTSTVVNNEVVEEPVEFVTEIALKECHLPIVQPNSILVAITGQGKTRGKAAILRYEATINQHIAFVSPDFKLVMPEYLQLFLSSVYEILRMISEGTGSTKGALTCEQLGEFTILLPPIKEQQGIVDYISEQTSRIDELSQKAQLTIDLLRERREALIAEAVSGQFQLELNMN